jgi:hypothetical protein
MSDIVQHQPNDDDGFDGSFNSGRLIKGSLLKWSAEQGWTDRDGAATPDQLLNIAIDEALQRWQGGKAQVIRNKPLPDEDELNAAIPQSEWETNMSGNLQPPWSHVVVSVFIDPKAGGFYTYVAPTVGAHIAVDALKESVISMRMLRRSKVLPIVKLDERPMKTKFGMKSRPHFTIVDWREPDNNNTTLTSAPEPQRIEPPKPEQTRPQGSITIDPPVAKPTVDIPAAAETKPAKGKGKVQPATSTKPPLDDGLDDLPFA